MTANTGASDPWSPTTQANDTRKAGVLIELMKEGKMVRVGALFLIVVFLQNSVIRAQGDTEPPGTEYLSMDHDRKKPIRMWLADGIDNIRGALWIPTRGVEPILSRLLRNGTESRGLDKKTVATERIKWNTLSTRPGK
jgi:hypothetical protein